MPPPPRACAAGRQRGARPAVVSGASAPGLRKYSGALGGRERRLSPEAGPSLAPESQAFLDLCCVSPGGPLARCPPRRRAPRPAPRPGPPTHRGGRSYSASPSSPSRTRRPAAARADGRAGGRRSRGGRGRGRTFPGRRACGAESGRLSPLPGLAGPVPGLPVPRVPRGPDRCVGEGRSSAAPKVHRWPARRLRG